MIFETYDELKTAVEDTLDGLTDMPAAYDLGAITAAVGERQSDGSWEVSDTLTERQIQELVDENRHRSCLAEVEVGPDFLGVVVFNPHREFIEEFEFSVSDPKDRRKVLISGLSESGYAVTGTPEENVLTLELV